MTLQKLPVPESGAKLYSDDSLRNFGVKVTQGGAKSFVLTVGRERQRITIGRYGPGGLTLAEARRKAITILHERELGIEHKPVPTFQAVKLEYLARRDGEIRAATLQGDSYLFKHFGPLLSRKLDEITPTDIERIIDTIDAPSTRRSAYIRVSGLFNFAARKGYIDHSPVKALPAPPDQTPRDRVLTDDELRKVLTAARMRRLAGDRYGAILELLIYTLQRRQQIAGLGCHHVDRINKTIMWNQDEMKGKKRHTIPLTKHVEAILDQFEPSQSGLYFASRIGTPFCGFPYHFRKLTSEVGFSDFVLHDFGGLALRGCSVFA